MKKYRLKSSQFSVRGQKFKINYQKELNPEQYAVVTKAQGPCLVLAGAGSGKTRTLVYRVAYLLEQEVSPQNILLMTFTNKAAQEMINRVENLLKEHPKGLWAGTFHHVGNRILRIYGQSIALNPKFNIIDEEDAKGLLKVCLRGLAIAKDRYFPKPAVLKRILSLAVNLCQPIRKIIEERFSYLQQQDISRIEEICKRYEAKKQQSNSLDFDDLLLRWNELLKEDQNLQASLSRQFQYILVDEYQDTNHLQAQIIKSLANPNQNILVVGDDSQSIYSFRGADISNILNFPKIFPKTKIFKLETNYRSTPQILSLANASIKNNAEQFEKVLHTSKENANKPVIIATKDVYEQADFICQRILELNQGENISLNDIAILFRSHFHSLEFEMELNKRGIPYEMRGGMRFFEQAHIKDAIAFLRIILSLHDELAWQRVLAIYPGIGAVTIQRIWEIVQDCTNLDKIFKKEPSVFLTPRALPGWKKCKNKLKRLSKIDINNVSALLEAIIDQDFQACIKQNYENFEDRLDDLEQLILFAGRYKTLNKFLSDVALSESFQGQTFTGYQEGPDEQITLSTIHRAKGLEWKIVFVIALVDGCFPHAKVFEYPQELEEERRLFYVATTRAQEELYLTYPLLSPRGATLNQSSCFLKELPADVYEEWSLEDEEGSDLDEFEDVIDEDQDDPSGNRTKPKVDLIDFTVKPF